MPTVHQEVRANGKEKKKRETPISGENVRAMLGDEKKSGDG